MTITKNIIDIITIQNSCKEIIQELYTYDSRSNETIRSNYKKAKIDDAIALDILEYDNYDDELTLSSDTKNYYRARLGQDDETNIGLVGDKLIKLKRVLQTYNIRTKNNEDVEKDLKTIYQILVQIAPLLNHNLQAISSNSLFAFKNEPNFDIKILNLNISKDEIAQLIEASKDVDDFLQTQHHFFKSMNDRKITSAILKLKHNSVKLESSFRTLFREIKNFINQTIKDGKFIQKIKKLKELKDDNTLFQKTNIEEHIKEITPLPKTVKEKRLHPDDKIHDYSEMMQKIIVKREIELKNIKISKEIDYDIQTTISVEKNLYDYPSLHKRFLAQEKDLISFLKINNIEDKRLLGVFVRMLKNYSSHYIIENDRFITIDNRIYAEVLSERGEKL